jgi:hypothetical protein
LTGPEVVSPEVGVGLGVVPEVGVDWVIVVVVVVVVVVAEVEVD